MTGLFYAHSGVRYLVLLLGLVALVLFAYAFFARRPATKVHRIVMAAFTGVLDLQVVLGILLVIGGLVYDALIGHLMMMLLAVVAAHGAGVLARRAQDDHRAHGIRLAGVVLALLLIAGGVMAIGRSLFGSAPPSM
jgi:heme A synthase